MTEILECSRISFSGKNFLKERDIMKKTTLVIMAAGLGSRFGQGIKQLTSFGPFGEIIMDYSIYDAKKAGFDKILFVIRRDLEKDFREIIGDRIGQYIDVDYTFQETSDLPEGYALPEGRKKPWGTGHAILACRGHLNGPFAVINADDYYGPNAFKSVHDYLTGELNRGDMCMSGFVLKNTLSAHGGVTRGLCGLDASGNLTGIAETRGIVATEDGAKVPGKDGENDIILDPNGLVSMNFWGFSETFLETLKERFITFLNRLTPENEMSAEYLLPDIVDELIREDSANVKVLPTSDTWFGVTYQEDIPIVKDSIRGLIDKNVYPEKLWSKE